MKFAIRVDASLQIGSGHVMRCLTLADALTQQEAECHFLCREHPGNLIEMIKKKGYSVHCVPNSESHNSSENELAHAKWLGVSQDIDVRDCKPILNAIKPDWIIVDHYALDKRWEEKFETSCNHLMVIDDLADRHHKCALILDQNLSRHEVDYAGFVPEKCKRLIGPRYSLLRPEFSQLRPRSLKGRVSSRLKKILISMGGVDFHDTTTQIMRSLKELNGLPVDCEISIVMGPNAPWVERVQACAKSMPWTTNVFVNISNIAEIMVESDLIIGAAGSTAWERCCLGTPTFMIILAENQMPIANGLEEIGAAYILSDVNLTESLQVAFKRIEQEGELSVMSKNSASVTDGLGAMRVVNAIKSFHA